MEMLRAFFGWCTVINGILLLLSVWVCVKARDWIYRIHSGWFPITRESFDLAIYCFLGAMELVVLMFNLVPYIALVIIT